MTAYVIARVNVTDPDKYENYKALAPAAIKKYGGEYLARGGAVEIVSLAPSSQKGTAQRNAGVKRVKV